MKSKLLAKLALGVGCLVALCDSCTKTNEFVPHADVPFSIELREMRHSHEFVWRLEQNGLICPEQEKQELWVTAHNTCIIEAQSEDAKFDGVNFSSSRPSAIRIEKIDEKSCRLIYVSDEMEGVTISAFTDNIRHSFTLYSKSVIELESVRVALGKTEYMLPVRKEEYSDLIKFEPAIKDIWSHPTDGELFTVLDLVPENASVRKVKAWGSSRFLDLDEELNRDYGPWPTNTDERNLDWSELKGRQFWYSPDAETYLFRVEFNGVNETLYASLWGRYMWLKELE